MSDTKFTTSLSSQFASFNPFSKQKREDVDDELGEATTNASVAGGGHSARDEGHTKRISHALKSFIVEKKILSKHDVDLSDPDHVTPALAALLNKPHIEVPSYLTDRSHPLPEYYVSSSHNTYLLAHQLIGTSSAEAYEKALTSGSRCVEIDAWDNDDNLEEPKVTHGYTLVSNISFRSVCETIRDCFDKEAAESIEKTGQRSAPILLSLENHCGPKGQLRLVEIMKEIWGDRLLSKAIRDEGHQEQEGGQHVRLEELGAKIVVIVEHHLSEEPESSDSDTDSSTEDLQERENKHAYKEKKKATPGTIIIPELADLGVYAQSVKPADDSWYSELGLRNGPHHHLINVSETGLSAHLPTASKEISIHNAHHLMRVFPKGTRISSQNLNPVPFWAIGAQICALNWQTFGAGMQLNDALFSGTDGYVLKPGPLQHGGSGSLSSPLRKKLRLHIAGATSVPVPPGLQPDEIKPYVTCSLIHPLTSTSGKKTSSSSSTTTEVLGGLKKKTAPYKYHSFSSMLHSAAKNPKPTDPVWDEVLEWRYEDNELVFLRVLVKSDESFAANPVCGVAAVRVLYVERGMQ